MKKVIAIVGTIAICVVYLAFTALANIFNPRVWFALILAALLAGSIYVAGFKRGWWSLEQHVKQEIRQAEIAQERRFYDKIMLHLANLKRGKELEW